MFVYRACNKNRLSDTLYLKSRALSRWARDTPCAKQKFKTHGLTLECARRDIEIDPAH